MNRRDHQNHHNCQIDWFVNRGGHFELVRPLIDGIFRSEVFPGLSLDAAALVRRDGRAVQAALRQGLGSPEHAEFVARRGQNRPA